MGTRRTFLKTAGAAGAVSLSGCTSIVGSGSSTTSISMLGWANYDTVIDEIESKLDNIKLDITVTSGSGKIFSNWNSGGNKEYDLTVVNNQYVPQFAEAGLIDTLPMDVMTNFDKLYDQMKKYAKTQFSIDGDIYGMPMQFGWYTFMYNSKKLSIDSDTSYELLFDKQYKDVNLANKVYIYDGFYKTMSMTALHLGYRDAFSGKKVSLSKKQLEEVKNALIKAKSHILGFTTNDKTVANGFKQGNVLVSYGGRNDAIAMQQNGYDWVKLGDPSGGKLAWFEGAMVSSESNNKKEAWKVLNAYNAPKIAAKFAEKRVIPSCCEAAQQHLSDEYKKPLSIPPEKLDGILPFKPIENKQQWLDAWQKIKAA